MVRRDFVFDFVFWVTANSGFAFFDLKDAKVANFKAFIANDDLLDGIDDAINDFQSFLIPHDVVFRAQGLNDFFNNVCFDHDKGLSPTNLEFYNALLS